MKEWRHQTPRRRRLRRARLLPQRFPGITGRVRDPAAAGPVMALGSAIHGDAARALRSVRRTRLSRVARGDSPYSLLRKWQTHRVNLLQNGAARRDGRHVARHGPTFGYLPRNIFFRTFEASAMVLISRRARLSAATVERPVASIARAYHRRTAASRRRSTHASMAALRAAGSRRSAAVSFPSNLNLWAREGVG